MSYIGKQPRKTALTASDIEDGIITAAKIEDGAVVAAEIASNAVTTAKINADAVTSAKIADNAVVTAAINADAVTAAKIADDAISEEHLDVTAVTGHTAETTVADGDLVVIHDASATALRKMTVANLTANAGGGKINQVVTNYDVTERRTNSTSFQAVPGVNLNITPTATNSKILITFGLTIRSSSSNSIYSIRRTISGSTAALTSEGDYQGYSRLDGSDKSYPCFFEILDSPNTTSQVTYQMYFKNNSGGYAYVNEHGSAYSHIRAMEVLA